MAEGRRPRVLLAVPTTCVVDGKRTRHGQVFDTFVNGWCAACWLRYVALDVVPDPPEEDQSGAGLLVPQSSA